MILIISSGLQTESPFGYLPFMASWAGHAMHHSPVISLDTFLGLLSLLVSLTFLRFSDVKCCLSR
jgi:hypothetical protein